MRPCDICLNPQNKLHGHLPERRHPEGVELCCDCNGCEADCEYREPVEVATDCEVCGVELGLGLTMVQRALPPRDKQCISCAQFILSTPDDEFAGADV